MKNLIGKRVLIRCPDAGVFIGTLTGAKTMGNGLARVRFIQGQRIWDWSEGNLETMDLAARGPVAAKMSPVLPTEATVLGARELFPLTDDAEARFAEVGVWDGK